MSTLPKKSLRYILLGMIFFLVSGFMNGFTGSLGKDVYDWLKAWIFSPKPQIDFLSIGGDALAVVGLFLILYGLYLRIPDYTAGIVGRRTVRAGGTIRFKARFRGELHNGLFTCKVRAPEDSILPDTKLDHVWWPAYDTVERSLERIGKVKGKKAHKVEWSSVIPTGYPPGEYRAFIRLYECAGKDSTILIRQREQIFKVVGT